MFDNTTAFVQDLGAMWKEFRIMRQAAREYSNLGADAVAEAEDVAILKDAGEHGTRMKVYTQKEELGTTMFHNVVRFAKDTHGMPRRGTVQYDMWLDNMWKNESILAGAVYSMVAKMQTLTWKMEGNRRNTTQAAHMLSNAKFLFGTGWSGFIASGATDFYTQDNGVFWDVTRRNNGKFTKMTDLAAIDTRRCLLTGSSKVPMYYCSALVDDERYYKPWEFVHFSSMPLPNELEMGRGFCAISRAARAANLLMALHNYDAEKLSNLPPEGVASVTGLTNTEFRGALKMWAIERKKNNSLTFPQVLWLIGSNPNAKVGVDIASFSTIPESFDRQTVVAQYVNTLALCFGVDTREFWAISTGALGTASEAEVQHMKARGKGGGEFLTLVERYINYELPSDVTFKFDTQDIEEDAVNAGVAGTYIQAYLPLVYPTNPEAEPIIDLDTFKRMMADAGIIPEWAVGDDRVAINSDEVHKDYAEDVIRFTWIAGKMLEKNVITLKGGKGSGNFGHSGRPGMVGGSGPGKASASVMQETIVASRGRSNAPVTYESILPEDALDYTTSMLVRSILPRGKTGDMDPESIMQLTEELQRHPSAVLDMLNDHDISVHVATSDAVFEKEYNRSGGPSARAKNVAAYWLPNNNRGVDGRVVLRPGMTQSYFDHEIGHAVYDTSRGQSKWVVASKDPKFDKHTRYSETDVSEAFAESYMTYLSMGGRAISTHQKRTFAVVKEVIDGIE